MSGLLGITWRLIRRCAVAIIGSVVVLIGICMIVLPGPAIIVIPAGLAILGIEFAWARLLLKKARAGGDFAAMHFRKRWGTRASKAQPAETLDTRYRG
jgi:uncharacterized protein (TIGR02611 family)